MSQSKPSPSNFQHSREEAEQEVRAITAQLKKPHREESERIPPFLIGWTVDCPHCRESFKLTYQADGTYELTLEA